MDNVNYNALRNVSKTLDFAISNFREMAVTICGVISVPEIEQE
jgi:hypothetical protein